MTRASATCRRTTPRLSVRRSAAGTWSLSGLSGHALGPAPARPGITREGRLRRSRPWTRRSSLIGACRGSRAASSSGLRSRRLSSTIPIFCSSTSRSRTSTSATSTRSSSCSRLLQTERGVTIFIVAHDLNPLALRAHRRDLPARRASALRRDRERRRRELLTHLYGTPIKVVRTAQGDLFTRSG